MIASVCAFPVKTSTLERPVSASAFITLPHTLHEYRPNAVRIESEDDAPVHHSSFVCAAEAPGTVKELCRTPVVCQPRVARDEQG
eukprot:6702719-Prymnesium_polylepis.1